MEPTGAAAARDLRTRLAIAGVASSDIEAGLDEFEQHVTVTVRLTGRNGKCPLYVDVSQAGDGVCQLSMAVDDWGTDWETRTMTEAAEDLWKWLRPAATGALAVALIRQGRWRRQKVIIDRDREDEVLLSRWAPTWRLPRVDNSWDVQILRTYAAYGDASPAD